MTLSSIILVAYSMGCPAPSFFNESKFYMNDYDLYKMAAATKTCSDTFYNEPCLHKFIKVDSRSYNVICGPKRKDAQ